MFYCYHIFKWVTFQGVLNLEEEEKFTLHNVWWVQQLPHSWNVASGWKLLHTLGWLCQCLVMMNFPCTTFPFFLVIYGKLHDLSTSKYKFFFTFWSHGAYLWCTILSCFKKVMSAFFCLKLGAPAWVVVIMFSIVMIIVWFQLHKCTSLFYQQFLNKILSAFAQLSESVAADIWCFFCFVKYIQKAPIFYGCVLPSWKWWNHLGTCILLFAFSK